MVCELIQVKAHPSAVQHVDDGDKTDEDTSFKAAQGKDEDTEEDESNTVPSACSNVQTL